MQYVANVCIDCRVRLAFDTVAGLDQEWLIKSTNLVNWFHKLKIGLGGLQQGGQALET
ncbi:MAG: hypothetical protein OXC91_12225 [Rhodobacteraceae bacterium]|nr:hypothetical protein [Paracoccaceae bacterium]